MDSINTPLVSGSILRPGDSAVTRMVLCHVQHSLPPITERDCFLNLPVPHSVPNSCLCTSITSFWFKSGSSGQSPAPKGDTNVEDTHRGKGGRRSVPARTPPRPPPLSASV